MWLFNALIRDMSKWLFHKLSLVLSHQEKYTCNEGVFRTNENTTFESFIHNIGIFNLIPNFVSYYFSVDILMLVFERDSNLTAAVAVDISISGVHLFLTFFHQIELVRSWESALGVWWRSPHINPSPGFLDGLVWNWVQSIHRNRNIMKLISITSAITIKQ